MFDIIYHDLKLLWNSINSINYSKAEPGVGIFRTTDVTQLHPARILKEYS